MTASNLGAGITTASPFTPRADDRVYIGTSAVIVGEQHHCLRICVLSHEGTTCATIVQPQDFFEHPALARYMAREGVRHGLFAIPHEAAVEQMLHAIDGRHTIIHLEDLKVPTVSLIADRLSEDFNPATVSNVPLDWHDRPDADGEGVAATRAQALKKAHEQAVRASLLQPLPHLAGADRKGERGDIRFTIEGPLMCETWTGMPMIEASSASLRAWSDRIRLRFAEGSAGQMARAIATDLHLADDAGYLIRA